MGTNQFNQRNHWSIILNKVVFLATIIIVVIDIGMILTPDCTSGFVCRSPFSAASILRFFVLVAWVAGAYKLMTSTNANPSNGKGLFGCVLLAVYALLAFYLVSTFV